MSGRASGALPPAPSMLLATLVLARNHPVDSARLATALWGEHPPSTFESALRVHLTTLRKAVGAERLANSHAGYTLDLTDVRLDVNELEECESLARTAGDRAAAERGLALWRGQSLANVRRLPGGGPAAVMLDSRREALTTARRSLVLRDGDGKAILAELEAELVDDPLDEQRWAFLAHAQYQCSGSHEALQTISRARIELVERAGLEPSPILRDIERRILEHDPSVAGQPRAQPSDRRSLSTSNVPVSLRWRRPDPFVGRDDELELLTNCWQECIAANSPVVVVVRGRGGIGKTSLASEAATRIAAHGRVVHLEVSAATAPLKPFVQTRRYLPSGAADDAVRLLATTIDTGPEQDDGASRPELVDAGAQIATALGHVPTLLVVDGAEWLDDVTADIIDAAADGQAASSALLIVALERDDRVSRLRSGSIIRVSLGPLGIDPIARWIDAVGSARSAIDVEREASGIPLLVALAIEQRGDWERRLHSVSATARATAAIVALLGARATFEAVRLAANVDELPLLDDLDNLQRAGLLSMSTESDAIDVVHDLARTSILDTLAPFRLQRTATTIISRVGPATLGPHLTLDLCRRAGSSVDGDVLVAATAAVAQSLISAFDFVAAKRTVEETLAANDVPQRRLPLLSILARTSLALGDYDEADAAFGELREAVANGAPAEIEAQLLYTELNLGVGSASKPQVVERLRAVIPSISMSTPLVARGLRRRLIVELLNIGEYAEASAVLAAIEQADTDNFDRQADLLPLQHFLAVASSSRAGAARVFEQARALRRQNLGPRGRTSLAMFFAAQAVETGEVATLDQLRVEIATNATAAGEGHARWWAEALRFTVLFWNADLEQAAVACEEAHAFGRDRLVRTATEVWAAQRILLAWAGGGLPDLLPSLAGEEIPLSIRAVRSLAHAIAGDRTAALADLGIVELSLTEGRRSFLTPPTAAFAIEAACRLGSPAAAAQSRRILESHVGPRCGFAGLVDLGPVERYLALCDLAEGDSSARARLESVINNPASAPIWRLRAEFDAGRNPASNSAWSWLSQGVGRLS